MVRSIIFRIKIEYIGTKIIRYQTRINSKYKILIEFPHIVIIKQIKIRFGFIFGTFIILFHNLKNIQVLMLTYEQVLRF